MDPHAFCPLKQVSLIFITGHLLKNHNFNPITAGVFLLPSSYCLAICLATIRRERLRTAGAEGAKRTRHKSKSNVMTAVSAGWATYTTGRPYQEQSLSM